MKKYRVLTTLKYAATSWNPGQVVEMTDDRAAKFLDAGQIEAIEDDEDDDLEDVK